MNNEKKHFYPRLARRGEIKSPVYSRPFGERELGIRPLGPSDVVRIISGQCRGDTGVVNRIDSASGMINVFQRGSDIGIWFFSRNLKRIGRVGRSR